MAELPSNLWVIAFVAAPAIGALIGIVLAKWILGDFNMDEPTLASLLTRIEILERHVERLERHVGVERKSNSVWCVSCRINPANGCLHPLGTTYCPHRPR